MARAKLKQLRGDTLDAREALISAAQGLDECTGLSNIGDPKNFHYHAGTCLEAVQEIYPAAQSFAKAGHHEHAVQILFDVRDFDHGAEFLLNGRRNLNVALFERFLGMSRYHFFTRRQYRFVDSCAKKKAMKSAHHHRIGVCLHSSITTSMPKFLTQGSPSSGRNSNIYLTVTSDTTNWPKCILEKVTLTKGFLAT